MAWGWGLVRPVGGVGDSSGHGSGTGLQHGTAEEQVSQCAVGPALGWGPAWLKGRYPGGAWI
jgi:hypothetical protein